MKASSFKNIKLSIRNNKLINLFSQGKNGIKSSCILNNKDLYFYSTTNKIFNINHKSFCELKKQATNPEITTKIEDKSDSSNNDNPNKLLIPENEEEYLKLVQYYEDEYSKIFNDFNEKKIRELEVELSEISKTTCMNLIEQIETFTMKEKILFGIFVKQSTIRTSKVDLTKIRANWPAFRSSRINVWPKDNPDWDIITMSTSVGAKAASPEVKEEVKQEVAKGPIKVSLL